MKSLYGVWAKTTEIYIFSLSKVVNEILISYESHGVGGWVKLEALQ